MNAEDVSWFDSSVFMPHGHCYLWQPAVLAMNVGSDVLVGLAYVAISLAFVALMRRRADLPFRPLFMAFGVFIGLCGLTHWMSAWNVWHANYWWEGIIKVLTAAASVPAAVAMYRAMPLALTVPGPAQWNRVIEDLRARNRELEAFAATASHDLRSPLAALRFLLEGLRRHGPDRFDEDARRGIVIAIEEIERLSAGVDARLRLVRAAREPLQRRSIDLTAAVEQEISRLRAAMPEHAIRTVVQPGMSVDADPALVDLLLESLLGNAWKFTRESPTPEVHIGARRDGDRLEFYVRDNGAGFQVDDPARLFTPLQRFHDSGRFPGTGLGLAAAKQIVDRHEGTIELKSVPAVGTMVVFSLTPPIRPRERSPRAYVSLDEGELISSGPTSSSYSVRISR
jgi:signal transduction histidine kinase